MTSEPPTRTDRRDATWSGTTGPGVARVAGAAVDARSRGADAVAARSARLRLRLARRVSDLAESVAGPDSCIVGRTSPKSRYRKSSSLASS